MGQAVPEAPKAIELVVVEADEAAQAPPPPCEALLTADDLLDACGMKVTFAAPRPVKSADYVCDVRGEAADMKSHVLTYRVIQMEENEPKEVLYFEKPGISRLAGGQKGRYWFSVTEAFVFAPEGREYSCSEAALRAVAERLASKL